jgi:hypothetical protein
VARKPVPGVSYKAGSPIYELFITVRSADGGTTISLEYLTHALGDEPLQGHRWVVKEASSKPATSFQHLSNLAGWAVRRALAGHWQKLR